MPGDDINDRIGSRKSRKVSSTSEVSLKDPEKTLISILEEQKKQSHKNDLERAKKVAEAQAKEYAKFEKALGIKTEKERQKLRKKLIEEQNKKDKAQAIKDLIEYNKKAKELQSEYNKAILDVDSGATLKQRMTAIGQETKANLKEKVSLTGMMQSAQKLFNNLTQEFNSIMSEYAKYQIGINTRLQGTDKTFSGMTNLIKNNIGVTPYVKTQAMFENLNKLTELGIVYNLEQRAFLETIADNISTTFDATNGTLLRLVRLQQSDSTAARLGLETAVTQYLNRMYEDSSYLNDNFKSVTSSLVEATSQMTNEATIQFEYIVQKWLGSLSSVGLSDTTVSNLAQAIGYLGSGNISGLESMGGMRNLLIMAASRSGNLNYADMLSTGLDSSETNNLLREVVEYIQEIASTNNKVVQSQYASLFGITLSDMTAAKNLKNSLDDIASSTLNYSNAINELKNGMNTMGSRLSIGTMMDTLWSNLQYGLATNIADSAVMYATWKVTDMIQGLTGGINIPFINAVGTGIDLNTTVENLMKLGIVGASSLGMMGNLISGIGNTFDPASMLSKMQIGLQAQSTKRGSGLSDVTQGRVLRTTSASTYVGNTSGSDIQASTLAQASASSQETLKQKQQETVDYTKMTAEYLTNTFNTKMDTLLMMVAKSSSFKFATGSGEVIDESMLNKLMMGKETGIVVTEDKEADARATVLSTIGVNVANILSKLESGLSVTIVNSGGTEVF